MSYVKLTASPDLVRLEDLEIQDFLVFQEQSEIRINFYVKSSDF